MILAELDEVVCGAIWYGLMTAVSIALGGTAIMVYPCAMIWALCTWLFDLPGIAVIVAIVGGWCGAPVVFTFIFDYLVLLFNLGMLMFGVLVVVVAAGTLTVT
jgi:hypothetical protein